MFPTGYFPTGYFPVGYIDATASPSGGVIIPIDVYPITVTPSIHVGDVGLQFRATILDESGKIEDMSSATYILFRFQKPDGSLLEVVGTQNFIDQDSTIHTGIDGLVVYSTVEGDLDQDGTWMHQVYYEIGARKKSMDIGKIKVMPNLPLAQ